MNRRFTLGVLAECLGLNRPVQAAKAKPQMLEHTRLGFDLITHKTMEQDSRKHLVKSDT